jgi:hypothetical protein
MPRRIVQLSGSALGDALGEIRRLKHCLSPGHTERRYIFLTSTPYIFMMIVATSSAVLTAIALIDPGYRSIALTQAVSLLAGAY